MSTYIYGKLTKSRFYTPNKTYSHKISFPVGMIINHYVPCKIDDTNQLQVFYVSPVFNSYLTVAEENVYKLYALDNKMTITKTAIEPNKLYTFRIIEETNSLRVCEIYKNDILWVGKKTTGKIKLNKKNCEVITPFGRGECLLQNNSYIKNLNVILWKIQNDKMWFVEVDNPVTGNIEVTIDSVRDTFILVSNENIRGLLFKTTDNDLEDTKREKKVLRVYVKEELLGFYIFDVYSDLVLGEYIEATVVKKTDSHLLLKYQSHNGIISNGNVDPLIFNKKFSKIKGKIINITDGKFELSQIQQISVPFDIQNISDSEDVKEDTEISNTLTDILNLIKKYTEGKRYKEVTDIFYKHINTLNSTDKDNLCLVYCNFLQYTIQDKHLLLKEIKKVFKLCSDKLIVKLGLVSDNIDIIEYCYRKSTNKDLYKKYLEMCYKLDIEVTDYSYLDVAINFIYKYEDMPRIKTEKIVGNNKAGWISYINNEDDDYKRILFRRVVDMKWKINDTKEFYRMWMQFEKEHNGNVEEVRTRAKAFVENIKKEQI